MQQLSISQLAILPNEEEPCVTDYKYSAGWQRSVKRGDKEQNFVKLFAHLAYGVIHLCMAGEPCVELNLCSEWVIIQPLLGL